jgi:hypothetical protein
VLVVVRLAERDLPEILGEEARLLQQRARLGQGERRVGVDLVRVCGRVVGQGRLLSKRLWEYVARMG